MVHFCQNYIDCKEFTKVKLGFLFPAKAFIPDLHYFFEKKRKIEIEYRESSMIILFEEEIPEVLFKEVQTRDYSPNTYSLLLGYLLDVLPAFNKYLEKYRYRNGQFLIKPCSTTDVFSIIVLDTERNLVDTVSQNLLSAFPPLLEEDVKDDIYIRDFIDAISCFLYWNFDEAIRKIITSFERFFEMKENDSKGTFHEQVEQNIQNAKDGGGLFIDYDSAKLELIKTLQFVYDIRCKIVHNSFRLRYENGWFVVNAIYAALNAYKILCFNRNLSAYFYNLESHFCFLDSFTRGISLSSIKEKGKIDPKKIPILGKDTWDEIFVARFKISKQEKRLLYPKLANKKYPVQKRSAQQVGFFKKWIKF